MNETYNMTETSHEIGIPGIGRNKLYRILKALDIVDHLNRPMPLYIHAGFLTQPEPKINVFGWHIRRNVTLVNVQEGLEFVRISVLMYLKNNPMPKFPHRKRIRVILDL